MPDLTVLPPVQPFDRWMIPDRYRFGQTVAFNYLDQLSALVQAIEENDGLSSTLELDPVQSEQLRGLTGASLWDWLIRNGHDAFVRDLSYRHIVTALLADASHFLFESLVAMGKGKNTVSFALLRKPFKDNLLVLEWLLAEPSTFFDVFHGESTRAYAPDQVSREAKLRIIEGAVAKLSMPVFAPAFLYELRYSKRHHYSLEHLWQSATHLVTNATELATDPGNFNFVFSATTDREEQWHAYYLVVPPLILYTLAVAEATVGQFMPFEADKQQFREWLRMIAFVRHSQEYGHVREGLPGEDLNSLLSSFDGVCDRCGVTVPLDEPNTDRLWSTAQVQCVACGYVHEAWSGDSQDESPEREA